MISTKKIQTLITGHKFSNFPYEISYTGKRHIFFDDYYYGKKLHVKIEEVNVKCKKKCCACKSIPQKVRLVYRDRSASKWPKESIYCDKCMLKVLNDKVEDMIKLYRLCEEVAKNGVAK